MVHSTPPIPNFPNNASPVPNVWGMPWGPPGPGRGSMPGGFPGGGPPGPGPWGGSPGAWPFTTAPPVPAVGNRSPSIGGGGGMTSTPSTPTLLSSQALFKAVEEMEKDIARRVEELDKVRTEMRDSNPGRGRCGGGRGWGRGRGGGCGGRGGDENTQRLEEEIDELSRNIEKLKVEADAEFARELAAEDQKSGVW
ncbi:hypothetical protein CFIO01_02367 [Colletotrichum fioriniae PJ7]|uniref:Uncharacterized protein n=1 Tax=Colletotrichum fioriniae PJ7 TaxID=1445577 RepID=A0A010RW85_9PEZI|nr:hypothetical protein CFIO01_02367 [Colletotrichum fioriniae PJ7]